MAAGDIKLAYGASLALTITLASLATDANLLTGRESTGVDNTLNLYPDYLLAGFVTTGTSPTTAKEIRVYVVGLMEDATYPDVFDGTDSAETVGGVGTRDGICKIAAIIPTIGTSDLKYSFGPVSVASLFGGVMPKKFVVFITHNTAVNLNSTAGNHAIYITPVFSNIAA